MRRTSYRPARNHRPTARPAYWALALLGRWLTAAGFLLLAVSVGAVVAVSRRQDFEWTTEMVVGAALVGVAALWQCVLLVALGQLCRVAARVGEAADAYLERGQLLTEE